MAQQTMGKASIRMGVDIGGTFTDVVFIKDGALYRGKSDTTHYDLKVGFMNASRVAGRSIISYACW